MALFKVDQKACEEQNPFMKGCSLKWAGHEIKI